MKTYSSKQKCRTLGLTLFCLAFAVGPSGRVLAQTGGSLDLRRNVVAGGGNTSTGSGNLQVSGTVAQPAAGTETSGGTFTQVGGFWPAILGVPSSSPGAGTLQFSAATFNGAEGCVGATITVTRTNGSTGIVSVDFLSSDGTAVQASDYSIASGSLVFLEAETTKTFAVLLTRDAYLEGNEIVNLTLSNATGGAAIGTQSTATLTILDDTSVAPSTQPIDDVATFVCQHYHDFLARTGDPGGAAFWAAQITQCGSNQTCIHNKRVDVSNAFYYELEFQQTGSYAYRLYRAAFGNNQPFPNPFPDPFNPNEEKKVPAYLPFMKDRARVRGGAELAQLQLELANAFVQRPEFLAKYPAPLNGSAFIDALVATIGSDIGVDLNSQKPALLLQFNQGGRGQVIYRLADDDAPGNPINNRAFIDAEYNRAFVFTQYAGYLRRDPDMGGFLFWLGQVNSGPLRDSTKQHAMVCSFMTSVEYQLRFSAVVTHANGECQ